MVVSKNAALTYFMPPIVFQSLFFHRLTAFAGKRLPNSYGFLRLRAAVLGLVFCLADPAGAGWRPEEPPAEFAGPYEGKLTVRRVPLREIPGYCRNIKGVYGCAYWNTTPPACLIYIPDNVPPKLEAAIYAHELGHCNGWQHPYPGKLPEATKPVELKIDHEIAVKRARENPMCQEEPKPESCP